MRLRILPAMHANPPSPWPASFWAAETGRLPGYPALTGDRRADLAVIGAGYAGLNAALEAATRGVEVAVLEAAQPGWGASGRNGGFACLGGTLFGAAALHKRFGDAPAATIHRFQRTAIDQVAANLAEYGIDASAGTEGEICLAHHPAAMAGLHDEADFLNRAHGLGVTMLPRAALAERGLGPAGFAGGMLTPVGFPLDPMAYVLGLARAAAGAGVAIHGSSPVTSMVHDGGAWLLQTPGGTVRARRVVLAMNAYADPALGAAGTVLTVPSSILVTRPLSSAEETAQNWPSRIMAYDSRRLLHYFRRLPDGRFLFGMRGGFGTETAALRAIRARMHRHFAALFPEWAHVEAPYFWSGLVALTARGVPFVGPVPGRPGMVAAFGFHGNGVAAGSLAGRLAVGCALGDPTGAIPAPFGQPPARLPPRWLARPALSAMLALAALQDGRLRAGPA
jgi:glycine/D-amino acid oxidase-like deaminating enzyme